jgi:DNA-binding transcriptional ArsR family regulator
MNQVVLELDRLFGALADPTRRAIVHRLAEGSVGVVELARDFPISQPAVSKHLKVLEDAGLVSRQRSGRQRLCTLEARQLRAVAEWVTPYRRFWETSFARLDEHVAQLQEGDPT